MIQQVRIIIWKEWKEILLQRDRSRKDALARAGIATVVFLFLVWRVGLAFVDRPSLLLMPAFVLLFCVIAIVADSFAGERERHTLETLLASRLPDQAILIGKIASAVFLSWGLMFLMLVLGLIGVNLVRSAEGVFIFPLHRIVAVLAFAFLLCLFIGCAGVLVSLRASTVRQATQILNIGFMTIGFAMLYAGVMLPQEWRMQLMRSFAGSNLIRTEIMAAAALLAIDLALFAAARFRFRRDSLILD